MSPYFSANCQSADCTTTVADTWYGDSDSLGTAAGAAGTWDGDYNSPSITWAGDYANSPNTAGTTDSDYHTLHVYIYPGPISVSPGEPIPIREETEGERQARLEQQKEAQRRAEEAAKKREEATKRAEELLKEHIGLEAFGKLHEVGYIEVGSRKHKGRRYRIPRESTDFIDVIDENDRVIDTLCVHPAVECPPGDHILARVILLQLDESYILERANSQGPREGGSV